MDKSERHQLVRDVFQKVAEKLQECNRAPSPAVRMATYDSMHDDLSFQYEGYEFIVPVKSVKVVEY